MPHRHAHTPTWCGNSFDWIPSPQLVAKLTTKARHWIRYIHVSSIRTDKQHYCQEAKFWQQTLISSGQLNIQHQLRQLKSEASSKQKIKSTFYLKHQYIFQVHLEEVKLRAANTWLHCLLLGLDKSRSTQPVRIFCRSRQPDCRTRCYG